jgi:hypothetical protein
MLLDGYEHRWQQVVVHHNPAEFFSDKGYEASELAKTVLDNIVPLIERGEDEEPPADAQLVTDRAIKWIEYVLLALAGKPTFDEAEPFFERVGSVVKAAGTPKQSRAIEHLIHAIHVEFQQAQSQYHSSVRSYRSLNR